MLRAITALPGRRRVVSAARVSGRRSSASRRPAPITQAPHLAVLPSSRSFGTDADRQAYEDFVASLSPARTKFHRVLNDYKAANFEHATPGRFFKMIVAAVDANHDGVITMDEYRTLLENIGARDEMTDEDVREIFEEVGVDNGDGEEKVISVESLEERWTPFLHVMWKRGMKG